MDMESAKEEKIGRHSSKSVEMNRNWDHSNARSGDRSWEHPVHGASVGRGFSALGRGLVFCGLFASALSVLVVFGSMSGCKREGKQVRKAYETTLNYATMFDEKRRLRAKGGPLPKGVWRAAENNEDVGRRRLELEIFVSFSIPADKLKKRLQHIALAAKRGSSYKAIRVRAWPDGLVHFGGVMGSYVLASDGGGWDRSRVGYRVVSIRRLSGLTENDVRLLHKLEASYDAMIKMNRYKKLAQRSQKRFEDVVVQDVAARAGLTPAFVRATVEKARRILGDVSK